jgi:zinc protease
MNIRRYALGALLAGAAGAAIAPARSSAEETSGSLASQASIPFEQHTLPNGLRVVLAPDSAAGTAALRIGVDAGDKDDPKGAPGMTKVIQRLLADPSTRHVPRALRRDLLAALEVPDHADGVGSNEDETLIGYPLAAPEVAVALWLESDRLGFLLDGVDEAEVSEKLTGIKPKGGTFAGALRLGAAALFGGAHPYGGDEIPGSFGAAEVRAHYRRYFVPRNMVIVVAGNFDAKAAKMQIEESFGPFLDTPAPDRPAAPPVELAGERRVRAEANVSAPEVAFLWPTPRFLEADDILLDGLAVVLRERIRARLLDTGLVRSFHVRQTSMRLASQFVVAAAASATSTPAEVERALDEELDRLRKEPPTAAEATRASREILTRVLRDTPAALKKAYLLALFLEEKQSPGHLPEYIRHHEAISAASIHRVMQRYLPKDRRVAVTVAAIPSAPAWGRLTPGGAK